MDLGQETTAGEDGSSDDQRALAAGAKHHDPTAWETIYRRVYPRLRAYVAGRVGRDHAEDLVNETMARAVSAIDRFECGPAGIDGWLFGIARRVTADHLRHNERERRAIGRIRPDLDEVAPGEALELSEEAALVRKQFALLPAAERELLELRVVAGLSSEQCADVLGKRPGAVRMAQSRALANLRRLMDDQ